MGYQPTTEELKFVYKLIFDGNTNSSIFEEYARVLDRDEFDFPLRADRRFVQARRRELEAANEVLRETVRRQVDPVLTQRREQHFSKLADIAQALLAHGLDSVTQISPNPDEPSVQEYVIMGGIEPSETIRPSGISQQLSDNLDTACNCFGYWIVMDCFQAHLRTESSRLASLGFQYEIEHHPYELTELLRVLANRGTFEGSCPICRHW